MKKKLNILQLTTHLNLGGISSYLAVLGPALSQKGHWVAVVSAGGQKAAELEKKGVRCFEFPIRTKSELDPRLYWALPGVVSLIKKEKFDLLHAHTRVTQVLAYWAGRLSGLPYISTAHGFYKPRWGRRVFPCWGEHAVAVSELVAEDLLQSHAVKKDDVTVVHNALDIEDFERRLGQKNAAQTRGEYGIPKDAFVVGCLSRLVRDKGQEYLIEAARGLVKDRPDIFLLIVGDGREKKRLESLVRTYALHDHVRLVPGVADTADFYSAIDVFAHPATYREGFGLSMAEAMIAKKPVVATSIPAINTLFQNGTEAILVPPKNAEALAAAIHTLAGDTALAQSLARNGHALAKGLCDKRRQAEEMERVYLKVLEKWERKKN